MLVVRWNSGRNAGYRDLLPSDWFKHDGDAPFLSHQVLGPKGGKSPALCALSVQGNIADLNYAGEHTGANERSFPVGTMRLIFTDASRTKVAEVQWSDPNGKFEPVDVECVEQSMPFEELAVFNPLDLKDGRDWIERMVVLRQGQPAFRNALLEAYERSCAITGCKVEQALEAAHISPYRGDSTNHVTNGLLLRADIHTLFDRGLIRVDRDHRIKASPDITVALGLPASIRPPTDPTLHPNKDALDQKWNLHPEKAV